MHGCDVFIEDGDLILSSLTPRNQQHLEECGESTGEVALSGEVINSHSPNRWTHQGSRQR